MIKEAAIKKGRKIFTGKRHCDCFAAMTKDGILFSQASKGIQGFVTDTGEFLTRAEAYKVAVQCKQIREKSGAKILISEDLY